MAVSSIPTMILDNMLITPIACTKDDTLNQREATNFLVFFGPVVGTWERKLLL